MSQHTVNILSKLSWNTPLFDTVKFQIETATSLGELYAERLPNTGEEIVAWIGSEYTPEAFILFFEARPGVLWVDQLYVQQIYRRAGRAKALMERVEEYAVMMGYRKIEYGTQFENFAALGLVSACGYDRRSLTLAKDLPDRAPALPPLYVLKDGDDGEIPF